MNVPELLQRVAACGYSVDLDGGGPRLVKARPGCAMPPRLLAELKASRDAVVEYLTTCGVCGRDVSAPEERAFVADPLGCDRGGGDAHTDGHGRTHEGSPRCPFKAK